MITLLSLFPGFKKTVISILTILTCLSQSSTAQTFNQTFEKDQLQAVSDHLNSQAVKEDLPGYAVMVFQNGEIINQGYDGLDNLSNPIRANTAFALGSISKSFTALIILQMQEEDLLSLDHEISGYMPQLSFQNETPPTIRQLLLHESGYSNAAGNWNIADTDQTEGALLEAALHFSNQARSKNTFKYSNGNYQLLGALIEILDRRPYSDAVYQRILNPLGMQDSFVGKPRSGQDKFAQGHRYWGLFPIADAPAPGTAVIPQSGVYTSARDLMTYLIALSTNDQRILAPSGRVWNIARGGDYGAGWFIDRSQHDTTWLYHGGLNAGYKAEAGFIPEMATGFLILTNASDGYIKGDISGITEGVRDLIIGQSPRAVGFPITNIVIFILLIMAAFTLAVWLIRSLASHLNSDAKKHKLDLRLITSIIGLAALCVAVFYGVPSAFNVALSGVMHFKPDMGWLLFILGLLAGTLASLKVVTLYLSWKQGPSS